MHVVKPVFKTGSSSLGYLFAEGLNAACCDLTCAGTDSSSSAPSTGSPHPPLHGPYVRNNEAAMEVRHGSEGNKEREESVQKKDS